MATSDKPSSTRKPRPASATPGTPEVSTASAWRKTSEGTPLVVPSGNTCLIRASSGLEMFVKNGSIPNSLMPIIQDAINKGKPPSMTEMSFGPEMLPAILELVDSACVFMVVQPMVRAVPVKTDSAGNVLKLDDVPIPLPLNEREQGEFLYVDEVSFEDKMFIFNVAVGGTADLEKFRQELGQYLELVPGS